ncbi:MAG TPA: exonuclease domain-containing protein, partial [Noviherbaspirillum sp.]|nr:exonuclease domain-containing protein [Noviherbaspirillum sp.]
GIIFDALYRRHVRLPFAMRERLEVVLGPNHVARLDETGPAGLRALAGAVNRLAEQRDALERDVAARVDEAKWRIEEERNRFATLIAELSQSIIVCNADGRILLYNNRARALFSSETDGGNIGAALVGLGRSIFGVLEHSLIAHGLEKIQQRLACGEARPIANFVTATPGGQLVRAQMAPVLQRERETADETDETDATIGGYVLILDDITRRVDLESQRDQLLQSLTEGARAALGNIRAAIENLSEFPDMEAPQRDRFIGIVREEAQAMSARLDRTVSQYSDALKVRWPLEEMAGTDLIQAAQRRVTQRTGLPAKTEELESGLWLKVDSFSLLQGISYLVARLQDEFNIREIRLRLLRSGRHAHVDIIWSGTVVSTETLAGWDLDPMSAAGESSPLTLREVIDRHDGELWFQREKLRHRAYFRILLPAAGAPPVPEPAPAAYGSRPEYYDFDLFQRTEASDALDQLPLAQLAYTVFDTETTGLEPSAGDEIIQIGAARIVNGRLLRGEVFEQLIDPRRPITAASVRVHGITQDMVVGQPTIERVLPRFHAFCQDTVLVAHNAAFDMRFLQLKENATGVAFRQPVLDTLLLSAVVHPNQDLHSLESIAERLGVALVGRHTALGDAIVTGEVLLKLIPLLAAQGIHTLRQAREASARTYYAKVGY